MSGTLGERPSGLYGARLRHHGNQSQSNNSDIPFFILSQNDSML